MWRKICVHRPYKTGDVKRHTLVLAGHYDPAHCRYRAPIEIPLLHQIIKSN